MSIEIGVNNDLVLISSARMYDPVSGDRSVVRYKGSKTAVEAEYETKIGTSIRASVEPIDGTPNAILNLEQVGPEGGDPDAGLQYSWSLIPQMEHLNAWDAPAAKSALDGMTITQVADFWTNIKEIEEGRKGATYDSLPTALKSAVRLHGLHQAYYQMWASLRKVRVVGANTAETLDHDNFQRVFTTAELVANEPSIPVLISNTIESGDWLKTFGGVEQMADGKLQLIVEYQYRPTGGWDKSLYYEEADLPP